MTRASRPALRVAPGRALRAALGPIGLALALACGALPAAAQVQRAFTPRFIANEPGALTLVGNTLMTCSGNCASTQSGSAGNLNNDNKTMVYVDVDGDPSTFSSSRATLALPAGAQVLWAGLYWGGVSTHAARGAVRFAVPGGGYGALGATQLDAMGAAYQGFADVTAAVAAAGNGSYAVADVRSTPGTTNVWAGWSLVVVYHLEGLLPRNLTVADGFAYVGPGHPVNLLVSGFQTPPAGVIQTSVGVIGYDGDPGFINESVVLNGTTLSDTQNPANNVFNSTVTVLGARFSAKTPDYVNQLGLDADLLSANGVLGNGSSSATITLTSAADRYYAGMISFTTDIFLPRFDATSFTKSVADLNGGDVRPGDVLEYTVRLANVGTDASISTVLRDTLPASLAYVAGSLRIASGANAGAWSDAAGDDVMEFDPASGAVVARLGAGATATQGGRLEIGDSTNVVFRARVTEPAVTGTVVSNQAWVSCVGEIMGVLIEERSDGDVVADGAQPTAVVVASAPIAGTVFEDPNYGGGAGRALAAAAGVGRPGARVELYDATGTLRTAVVTDAAGAYAFDGWAPGAWRVRVVNGSVTSSRPGAAPGLVPVQTFRADAAGGAALPVSDRVGGEAPAKEDAPANTANATFASLVTAASEPQSVALVQLGTSSIAGLDFGFNFSTVVNANDAGQGSLRQFLVNANALDNGGLAQQGQPPGLESAIFMVGDGAAHPGLRAGLPNLLAAGVARIPVRSPLPAVTGAGTRIDGAVQTANVGDTNPLVLSGAGTVGADALARPAIAAPEVELFDDAGVAIGLDVQAPGFVLGHVAVLGFGDLAASDAHAAVRLGAPAAGAVVEGCAFGVSASANADPGAARRTGGDHVRAVGADGGLVRNVLARFGGGAAVALTAGADGWTVEQCVLADNGMLAAVRGAIALEVSGGATVRATSVSDQPGPGVDALGATGGVTLENVRIERCGRGAVVTAGVRAGGPSGRVDRCELLDNFGAGVQVTAAASHWIVTRCAIARNGTVAPLAGGAASGQLGIDLQAAGDDPAVGTAPFVTRNDIGDTDGGGNALLNFPVIESAVIANGQLTLAGWARPGSTIELYRSDSDPSGFGEGERWLATVVEGSAGDLDAGVTAYAPPVNGLDPGRDVTQRFRFVIAVPTGVAPGLAVTATATLAGVGTSEFSGRAVVVTGVTVSGFAYHDIDHNRLHGAGEPGIGMPLWAKLVATGGTAASQVAGVDPVTGAFAFTFVNAASYTVVLDLDADPADVAPAYPAGWIGTGSAGGTRAVAVNATDVAGVDFGLWHGGRVAGVVVRDDGAPGGIANDGLAQPGEVPLAGVRVRLASPACAGGACDSTLTDATGAFELWIPHAASGAVEVREVNPAGWLSTGGSAGTTGGSYGRAADAVAFTAASGTEYAGLVFGEVPPNDWVAPSTLAAPAGGVVFHPHTYTAQTDGVVSVAFLQSPAPPLAGWSVTLHHDLDCDGALDAGEPPLPAGVALARGEALCVIARHAIPAAAPAGASESLTLTATFAYANASPALSAAGVLSDLTTVGSGLSLQKSVDLATARPGDVIVYTITYSNPGPTPLTAIEIHDATPPWTVFDGAACVTLGTGLTGCALTQQPAPGTAGAVRWTLSGSLAPGASGSVSFQVRVE